MSCCFGFVNITLQITAEHSWPLPLISHLFHISFECHFLQLTVCSYFFIIHIYVNVVLIVVVVVVSFTEREYSISEGAGSVRIGLHLNRVIDQIITVQVEMIGITAEG